MFASFATDILQHKVPNAISKSFIVHQRISISFAILHYCLVVVFLRVLKTVIGFDKKDKTLTSGY